MRTLLILLALTSTAYAGDCSVSITRNSETICNPGRPATPEELASWPETLTPEEWQELERQERDKAVLDELFEERLEDYPQR